MGYYKNSHTLWESRNQYEDDEVKELGQCDHINGVWVPSKPATSSSGNGANQLGGMTHCFYCGAPVRYNPNRINQECRACRHKAQTGYINSYKQS